MKTIWSNDPIPDHFISGGRIYLVYGPTGFSLASCVGNHQWRLVEEQTRTEKPVQVWAWSVLPEPPVLRRSPNAKEVP